MTLLAGENRFAVYVEGKGFWRWWHYYVPTVIGAQLFKTKRGAKSAVTLAAKHRFHSTDVPQPGKYQIVTIQTYLETVEWSADWSGK